MYFPQKISSSKKTKILVIGQAVRPTGYWRVLYSILSRINSDFEIIHFGINYKGSPINCGWEIKPNNLIGDVLGVEQLPNLLESFNPDIVFMCHDPWLYSVHKKSLKKFNNNLRIIYYCPIDFESQQPNYLSDLVDVDYLVTYNNFGKKVLERAINNYNRKNNSFIYPPIDIIPHGIDTKLFYPLHGYPSELNLLKSRKIARRLLFPNRPDLENAFIILNANRNCSRKRIDLTLKAFSLLPDKNKNNIWLYLHMGMQDYDINVLKLANELGIRNRLLLTTTSNEMPQVDNKTLNLIYNACDVGVNTSIGEGWGLIAFEHAATGAIQIVPDHSACKELWQDIGLLIPIKDKCEESLNEISVKDLARIIEYTYKNREITLQLSQKAYSYATSSKFNWDKIAQKWVTIFKSYK